MHVLNGRNLLAWFASRWEVTKYSRAFDVFFECKILLYDDERNYCIFFLKSIMQEFSSKNSLMIHQDCNVPLTYNHAFLMSHLDSCL